MTAHRSETPAIKARRTRRTAREAGTKFERLIADYLAAQVDDRIDRRAKNGNRDRGDIGGLRAHGHRVVIEAKDCVAISLGTWMNEADVERGNDDAMAAMVIHKRMGRGAAGAQWVTMTVDDLIALLTGIRPEEAL